MTDGSCPHHLTLEMAGLSEACGGDARAPTASRQEAMERLHTPHQGRAQGTGTHLTPS
jgi:hypothetical protein